jgi:hypothetical protein
MYQIEIPATAGNIADSCLNLVLSPIDAGSRDTHAGLAVQMCVVTDMHARAAMLSIAIAKEAGRILNASVLSEAGRSSLWICVLDSFTALLPS